MKKRNPVFRRSFIAPIVGVAVLFLSGFVAGAGFQYLEMHRAGWMRIETNAGRVVECHALGEDELPPIRIPLPRRKYAGE